MIHSLPNSLPEVHRTFLNSSIAVLQKDARVVGIAAAGSFLTDTMDEFSDLDLVVAIEDSEYLDVMASRRPFAAALGPLLTAFTGEHVGEPRLLICLYDTAPPLHVDLKFITLPDLEKRVEDPAVLWEREGRLSCALKTGIAKFPAPDPQWIEDRFWVWVHYVTTKLGRGELFEALNAVADLRRLVLGPLALVNVGARPSGVRRFEQLVPERVLELKASIATYNLADCQRALRACVHLYCLLRAEGLPIEHREAAESAAMRYLLEIENRNRITPD